jgi:hypothetical protein
MDDQIDILVERSMSDLHVLPLVEGLQIIVSLVPTNKREHMRDDEATSALITGISMMHHLIRVFFLEATDSHTEVVRAVIFFSSTPAHRIYWPGCLIAHNLSLIVVPGHDKSPGI